MTEDLNDRLKQSAMGAGPQTKPDERRRYLGSLRERVLVRMNNTEVQDPELQNLFLNHLDDYKDYSVLINGNLDSNNFLNKVESSCSKNTIPFTLVNNETAKTGPDDTAILVVAKTAINKPRVEIKQVYPPEMPKTELAEPKPKKNFFQRLFGDK